MTHSYVKVQCILRDGKNSLTCTQIKLSFFKIPGYAILKVSKGAKIRNRYNQVQLNTCAVLPTSTRGTVWKMTFNQGNIFKKKNK